MRQDQDRSTELGRRATQSLVEPSGNPHLILTPETVPNQRLDGDRTSAVEQNKWRTNEPCPGRSRSAI
ncbi:protein of unknown function [Methylorubrum extorquens]|uniref:Uncharacterized protein n=1 Tax=Methylorubrum extorquens TaxID=408 RepID=A0A2N9AUJ1_METEX|nr:protein of unknown function [Methylorubrum extorquens]